MTGPNTEGQARTETHKIDGTELVARIKALVHEGNVRRVIVKGENGQTLMEIPLTVGVVGAVLTPIWVALGAIAALASKHTIVVERKEP
ncbi:MAG TPA: DUF4342 domain-containing protein [Gemmatimonadaceae bacterium]|nr:DUF4342 domain-containing protein [Gemmatimonadaceae bacterium]